MSRRALTALTVLACATALALSACGKSSSTANTRQIGTVHAAAGFVVHAGLAFGAFKHFIYTPYKAGKLKLSHPLTLTKAGLAGVFAYHELKEAAADVRANKHLAKLAGPMLALGGSLHLIKSALEHGQGGSAVSSANSQIGSIGSQASSLGSPIKTITSGIHL